MRGRGAGLALALAISPACGSVDHNVAAVSDGPGGTPADAARPHDAPPQDAGEGDGPAEARDAAADEATADRSAPDARVPGDAGDSFVGPAGDARCGTSADARPDGAEADLGGDGPDAGPFTCEPVEGGEPWVRGAGGAGEFDRGQAIAVAVGGDVLVAGYTGSDEVTFDSTGSVAPVTLGNGVFLARYTPEGELLWARGSDGGAALAAAALPGDDAVMAGTFMGSMTLDAGEPSLVSAGSQDVFVAAYGATGEFLWARRAGGASIDEARGAAAFGDDVLVAGYFRNEAVFGLGEAGETAVWSAGFRDIFVARFRHDGDLAWVRTAGGSSTDEADAVAVCSGGIAVVGGYAETATFGAGERGEVTLGAAESFNAFLAVYLDSGELRWATWIASPDEASARAVACAPDGDLLVVGSFNEEAVFAPGEPSETRIEGGTGILPATMFLARYSPAGDFLWARAAGRFAGAVSVGRAEAFGVAALVDGGAIVAGTFQGAAVFGPGEPGETTLASMRGWRDVFVARYDADGNLAWARSAGGPNHDFSYGVAAGCDGTSFVTGSFNGTATFFDGESYETTVSVRPPAGTFNDDAFFARFPP